ncbi:ATP-binding cassette domain-containing protein [[Mycoplasma] testudinis]|uniref:ATP-binding cassette domain-containing protein n=1 Tax=[Mycoplasma] testudinis TaxID=33924 RepID=UPI0004891EB7|nr:ATP-binding cassette domain-containing protein [[Mycoplasma] testudinis]
MNQTNNKRVVLGIQNLKKYFLNKGNINKAVDGVSFDLHEGEIVGLIGESGSGKTTIGRALLRLYESYNGFVSLNGKIISGKRISRKTLREMRRNIQIIFQDPYAALNGQKNIYSILKEPLVVNKIIHEQTKKLFKNRLNIKKVFKTELAIKVLEVEIKNQELLYSLAKPYVDRWSKLLPQLKFDSNISADDNFNLLFSYLDEEQKLNTSVINQMYDGLSELLNYYYQLQDQFLKKEFYYDDSHLVSAQEELTKIKLGKKFAPEILIEKNNLKTTKKELKLLIQEQKDLVRNAKNVYINYIDEFKNERKLNQIERLNSMQMKNFRRFHSLELLNNKMISIVANFKHNYQHLSFEDAQTIVGELQKYSKEYYNENFQNDVFDKNIDFATKFLNFKFNDSEWKQKNDSNLNRFKTEISKKREEIRALKLKIHSQKTSADFAGIHLNARLKVAELKKNILKTINAHHAENCKQVKVLDTKIRNLNQQYLAEVTEPKKNLDKIFFEKNKEFKLFYAKNYVSENETRKSQQKISATILNAYETRLKDKYESLKSFKIEKQYLSKDIFSLKLLFGYSWAPSIHKEHSWKHTVLDILLWPLVFVRTRGLLMKSKIYGALEDVGLLKQFAYRYPHEFSGGQRQRIVIARALITQPSVVVADEPIASLDISIQAQVVNLLKDLCLQKNIAMLFIAHDLSMIEYIANRVEIIHLGKIVEAGETPEIYANPIHPYTNNLFKAVPKISNANKKFENIKFETEYLKEQVYPNVPTDHKIKEDHIVYGTDDQIKKWTNQPKANEEN